MPNLEPRISALEKRAGAGGRLERIRLVGINPDGTEGESAVIKVTTIVRGHMDFSKVPTDELRKLARIRIEDAD